MTKQVLELISDATVLSDIHSMGAVIIRLKSIEESSYRTAYKCLFIYEIGDSTKAELLAGLYGLKFLINKGTEIDFANSRWMMDIPHIEAIITKFRLDPKDPKWIELLDTIKENNLEISLPSGKNELKKHHLCHRMCALSRNFYIQDNLPLFIENLKAHLNKIESSWTITDQNT